MDDPRPSEPRHLEGHPPFGDRIHGGRYQRDGDLDPLSQVRRKVDGPGLHFAPPGEEDEIPEGEHLLGRIELRDETAWQGEGLAEVGIRVGYINAPECHALLTNRAEDSFAHDLPEVVRQRMGL